MSTLMITIAALLALSVMGIMALGIVSMAMDGDFNKKYGNRIMQARIWLQGLAIALLALAYFSSQG